MAKRHRIPQPALDEIARAYRETQEAVVSIAARLSLTPQQVYFVIRRLKLGKRSVYFDHTNERFGRLLVTRLIRNHPKEGTSWECVCDCGSVLDRRGDTLRDGRAIACRKCRFDTGEAVRTQEAIRAKYSEVVGEASQKKKFLVAGEIVSSFWNSFYHNALARGISFEITPEWAWGQFLSQDRKCWFTGEVLTFPKTANQFAERDFTASMDRLDSDIGYTEHNVKFIHKDLQKLKNSLSVPRFVELCTKVANHSQHHLALAA